jgi:hypothetical protein
MELPLQRWERILREIKRKNDEHTAAPNEVREGEGKRRCRA